jgi:periplasmic mercuric ion binding protein
MLQRVLITAVLVVLGSLGWSGAVFSASKTVTLSVPSMTCSACPITVKKALQKVPGVEKVVTTYEPKEAVVTFDDAKTTVEALRQATANAGYPSTLREEGKQP